MTSEIPRLERAVPVDYGTISSIEFKDTDDSLSHIAEWRLPDGSIELLIGRDGEHAGFTRSDIDRLHTILGDWLAGNWGHANE